MRNNPKYLNFTTARWNQLSIDERKQLLAFVENEQALRQKRQPIPIYFLDIEDYGSYSRDQQVYILSKQLLENNTSRINERGQSERTFNSFEALDTIIHEGYHREQHLLIMGDPNVMPYIEKGPKREKVKQIIRENFSNYSVPNDSLSGRGVTGFPEYYLQPIEISVVEQTTSDLIFNDALYQDREYQTFLNQKIDEEKQIRVESLKVYGPDYERKLTELREMRSRVPLQASQREIKYRKDQERYERDNRSLSRER